MNPKVIQKDDTNALRNLIKLDEPVIVIKNFENENELNNIRKSLHNHTKEIPYRLGDQFSETFVQMDVLPSKVQTHRIFRTFFFSKDDGSNIFSLTRPIFQKLKSFHNQYLAYEDFSPNQYSILEQVIHYPKGGGFFDWHVHTRFPVNYGVILILAKKDRDFKVGQTEIKVNNDIINIDDFADIGDLALFRFDLEHRVAPCDPREDLTFSDNGRWTAVLSFQKYPS